MIGIIIGVVGVGGLTQIIQLVPSTMNASLTKYYWAYCYQTGLLKGLNRYGTWTHVAASNCSGEGYYVI